MKICLLSSALSIHTKRWIDYFRSNGHKVYLISYRWSEVDGAEFYCYPPEREGIFYKSFCFLRTVKKIKKLIHEINPDILHAHYLTSYGLLGMLSQYRPLVVSVWGSDLFVDAQKSLFHRHIIKKVLERADLVTLMANHMAPEIRELGVREDKVMKVTLGINTGKFNIDGRKSDGGKTIILSNRVFEREQNIEYLISAVPAVMKMIDDAEVHFYGDGSRRAACMDTVRTSGVENSTRFFGHIPHERMPDCLKNADIYAATSMSDGDHVSLMEAMACGLFPVVSDIPSNREWIDDGKNGFLVPLDKPALLSQKLAEAVKRRDLREKVRRHNFELVKARAEFGMDLNLLLERYRWLSDKRANNELLKINSTTVENSF